MFEWLTQNRSEPGAARIEPTIGNLAGDQTASSSDREKMFEIFGNPVTASGAVVNHKTAMQVAAAYACGSLIAGSISQLPLPVYERIGDTRKRVDHDYWWLLNEQPTDAWSSSAFWEFMATGVLFRGDSIAHIPRNRAGAATGFVPYAREQVQIDAIPSGDPRVPRRLRYFFDGPDGRFGADQDDVIHLPGFGFNGIESMSVVHWGARSGIGIALKADEFAGKFYSQGAQPQFAVQTPGEMTPKQQDDFRDAWVRKYSGNGINGIPLLLTEGLDIKQLTLSAADAQLMEARQWQVIDVARAFGVPPVMIGESSKTTSFGSGVEQMAIWYRMHTLGPHLSRFQDELNRKLFRTSRYFVEFNTDGLLAGDSKSQAEYFAKALGGPGTQGWMSVNEVRRLKNLTPQKGHDQIQKSGAAKPASDPAPEPKDPTDNDTNDDSTENS